jgi:hypothetical protein
VHWDLSWRSCIGAVVFDGRNRKLCIEHITIEIDSNVWSTTWYSVIVFESFTFPHDFQVDALLYAGIFTEFQL